MKNITMFNKPYSEDKITEGMAVSFAIQNGDCNRCGYYLKCSSDCDFEFPEDAPCMYIKRKIKDGKLK